MNQLETAISMWISELVIIACTPAQVCDLAQFQDREDMQHRFIIST